MIKQIEDTVLWENLKENSLSTDRLLFILVSTKVLICVSPLLWGSNDAVLGVPSDKYGWLSSEYDTTMSTNFEQPETKQYLEKYNIDINEYNNILESLEKVQYLQGSVISEAYEENSTVRFTGTDVGSDNAEKIHWGVGEPKGRTPGGDPVRIIRSKQLYDQLLTYYASLSNTYGASVLESAIELWIQEMPTTTMDMPGFRGSQSWCLKGAMYISLNLYLLKMKNLKIKNLGPEL
jgi:hypothetical protein